MLQDGEVILGEQAHKTCEGSEKREKDKSNDARGGY